MENKAGLLSSSYRLKIALFLVVISAVAPSLKMLWNGITAYISPKDADPITMYEERFAGLKEVLPSNGVFGYITDGDAQDIEYFLTQYSLAPRVIAKDKNLPYVIGNFHAPLQDVREYLPLVIVEDFNNGLVLFKNEPAR